MVKDIIYVKDNKICTQYRKIIFEIKDYGMILSTGIENLYVYILAEKSTISFGILELYTDKFKVTPVNYNCNRMNEDSLIQRIINDIFVDGHYEDILNDPLKIEVMILLYKNDIFKLKDRGSRGDYIFCKSVIDDIIPNQYSYYFKDTFKNKI